MYKNIFDGRYEFLKVIGKGGMGKVYLAKNIKLETLWAIKEIKKETKDSIDFLAEPNILKKLDHPAIVRIFDIDEDENNIYIVEEFVKGISIEEELKIVKSIDEKVLVEWVKEICEALIYLHNLKPNPIIYRDMKPSNIMITKDGKVKIIDFGIAREYKKHAVSDTTFIGTRGYAAPEQYGTSQTDGRTDIYSLGVTLYHMATGLGPSDPPYEIMPIHQINHKLSEGLEYIILKATRQTPEERYQSAELLLLDLNNIEKFNFEYRKRKIMQGIKSLIAMIFLVSFLSLVYAGFLRVKQEKIAAYEQTIKEGIKIENNKQYAKATLKFKEAITKIPNRIEGYKEISKIYLKQRDYEGCIDYLENQVLNIVEEAIKDSDIYNILGTAYFNDKDYNNAVLSFERAYNIEANEVDCIRDLGVCYARTGKLDKAEKKVEEIKSKNMAEEVDWYLRGEILAAEKRPNEAIENYNSCIQRTKDEDLKKRAFISSAELYGNNKDKIANALDNQIAILERGNSELKEKNNLQIVEMLGAAYYEKGMSAKSNECFNQLLNSGFSRPHIYINLAINYQQIGDFKASEEILLKMKQQYPVEYRGYMQLALLYADIESKKPNESRNYNKTNENYQLAVKYAPNGEKTTELIPLINLIKELKKNNWILEGNSSAGK
ncbi:MAG: protein kinase [Clostridiaceae bacterium]|nr:protein kinase [Clostridiaceae bacterium]